MSNIKHKVGTQKQYLSWIITFLENIFKNIEMLKETKRNKSGSLYSELISYIIKDHNIRREIVIDICRYLARLNTLNGFFFNSE